MPKRDILCRRGTSPLSRSYQVQSAPTNVERRGQILQTVNLAQLYTDPKTFVDKPTLNSTQSVLTAFASINATDSNSTTTEGSVLNFVDTNFGGEGLELEALVLGSSSSNSTPAFLQNVTDPVLNAWAGVVNGYWSDLIRATNESAVCEEGTSERCESSLIPLNHTFVIPGGRFREQCEVFSHHLEWSDGRYGRGAHVSLSAQIIGTASGLSRAC